MDRIEDEFATRETDEISVSEVDETEIKELQLEGNLILLKIIPEETYDPEDSKWDQIIKLQEGDIIELRSSNPVVPSLIVGMKVMYGGESGQQIGRIKAFVENKKQDTNELDLPTVCIKFKQKEVKVEHLRHILKVLPIDKDNHSYNPNKEWIKANFSIDVPDEFILAIYKEKFQQTAQNGSFFIAVNDKQMLIRANDKALNDAKAHVIIEKDSRPVLASIVELRNGFIHFRLPEEIKITDLIKIKLFKKSKP